MFSLKGSLLVLCGFMNIIGVLCNSNDIIVDTKLNCSLLKNAGLARITVLSDAHLKANFYCQNNNFTYQMGKNQISLHIILTKGKSRFCQLRYIPEKRTYETLMTLQRIVKNTEVTLNSYRVICEEENTTSALVSVGVNNPFQSPQIIEHFCKDERSCEDGLYVNLDLEVRNILGQKLNNITVFRKVQLYANASLNYTGIQARECTMKTDEELTILKGGCGTGFIFNKNTGFRTLGKSAKSHFFLVPAIISPKASFSCKFRVCLTNCDGNSCVPYSRARTKAQLEVV